MQQRQKKEGEKYQNLMKAPIDGFSAVNPTVDQEHIEADESRQKRNEDWINNVLKDPYIYEALQIVEDWND